MNEKEGVKLLNTFAIKLSDFERKFETISNLIIDKNKYAILTKNTLINGSILPLEKNFNIGSKDQSFKNIYLNNNIYFNDFLEIGNDGHLFLNKIGRIGMNSNHLDATMTLTGLQNFIIENVYINIEKKCIYLKNENIEKYIGNDEYFKIFKINNIIPNEDVSIEELNNIFSDKIFKINFIDNEFYFESDIILPNIIIVADIEFLPNILTIKDKNYKPVFSINHFGEIIANIQNEEKKIINETKIINEINYKFDEKYFTIIDNTIKLKKLKIDEKIQPQIDINKKLQLKYGLEIIKKNNPPIIQNIEPLFSEDNSEFLKDTIIKYYIAGINNNNDQTELIQFNEQQYSSRASSISFKLSWEYEGFVRIYKEVIFKNNSKYWVLDIDDNPIIDTLIPYNFSQLTWAEIDEIVFKDETLFTVTNFKPNGEVLLHNKLIINPLFNSAIDINNNNENYSINLNSKYGNHISLFNNTDNIIFGNTNYGSSSIHLNNNIFIKTHNEESSVKIGYNLNKDINDYRGMYEYKVQIFDGGLYCEGNIETTFPNRYKTKNNLELGDGAILQTNSYNSMNDGLTFLWDRKTLKILPIMGNKIDKTQMIEIKNFCIQNPIDENKYLIHACLEGPTADVFYRGEVNFNEKQNSLVINLPRYFNKIADENSIFIFISSVDNFNKYIYKLIYKYNMLQISRKNGDKKEKANYLIICKRKDVNFEVEPNKDMYEIKSVGPYSWINNLKNSD